MTSDKDTVLLDMTEKLDELVVYQGEGRESVLSGVIVTDLHMPHVARVGAGRCVILSLLVDQVGSRSAPSSDEPIPYQVTEAGLAALDQAKQEANALAAEAEGPNELPLDAVVAEANTRLAAENKQLRGERDALIAKTTTLFKIMTGCVGQDSTTEGARMRAILDRENGDLGPLWVVLGECLAGLIGASEDELDELATLDSERWIYLAEVLQKTSHVLQSLGAR